MSNVICTNLKEKKYINGFGNVWITKYKDKYASPKILTPDKRYFVPEKSGRYLVLLPKDDFEASGYLEEIPIYHTMYMDFPPTKKDEGVLIYEADFFVPQSFLLDKEIAVLFRESYYSISHLAFVWVEDEDKRELLERYIRKNIPDVAKKSNNRGIININNLFPQEFESFKKKTVELVKKICSS